MNTIAGFCGPLLLCVSSMVKSTALSANNNDSTMMLHSGTLDLLQNQNQCKYS